MAAGPKFLAGAAPFSLLPRDLFPSRFRPSFPLVRPFSPTILPQLPPTPIFLIFPPVFFPLVNYHPFTRYTSHGLSPLLSLLLLSLLPFEWERRRRLVRRPATARRPAFLLSPLWAARVCFKRSLKQARGYDADCLCALYLARVMCTYVFDRVFIRTRLRNRLVPMVNESRWMLLMFPIDLWKLLRFHRYWRRNTGQSWRTWLDASLLYVVSISFVCFLIDLLVRNSIGICQDRTQPQRRPNTLVQPKFERRQRI